MISQNGHAMPLRGWLSGIAWTSLLLQAAVFIIPLILVFWLSLLASSNQLSNLSFTAWTSIIASSQARTALLMSALMSSIVALGTTILAWPLAFIIAVRGRLIGRLILGFIIMIWLIDPGIRVLGWSQTFKDFEILGFLPTLPLGSFSIELIAAIHAWLPLATFVFALSFFRVDRGLIEIALECGAKSVTLIRRILWPNFCHATTWSIALVFSGATGSFLERRLLGGARFQQASDWIQNTLESEAGWPYAAAMLLMILALATLPIFLLAFFNQRSVRS